MPARDSRQLSQEELDPLIRAAAEHDPAAIAALLAIVRPVAVRSCQARMSGRDLSHVSADDLAQEVCLGVLKASPTFRNRGGSFPSLVHAIAANKVADAYRFAARLRCDPVAELPDLCPSGNEPESRALNLELRGHLRKLLGRLAPLQREILAPRVVIGLTAAETAQVLGISEANVRVVQHCALVKIRAMIQDRSHQPP
ncbi:RNA polymerase subunit sigma [Amycolatopsis sp. A1MSW2902]